jgi:hypothetical protein
VGRICTGRSGVKGIIGMGVKGTENKEARMEAGRKKIGTRG